MSKVGDPVSEPNFVVLTTKEYDELKKKSDFLACLEANGVDN